MKRRRYAGNTSPFLIGCLDCLSSTHRQTITEHFLHTENQGELKEAKEKNPHESLAMASVFRASPPLVHLQRNPTFPTSSFAIILLTSHRISSVFALKTASDGGRLDTHDLYGSDLLRSKPNINPPNDEDEAEGSNSEEGGNYAKKEGGELHWVDWEDPILEETVPLVGLVRMILHSNRYKSRERLSPDHEKMILERLLPYHPAYESKIGCGVDYIAVGYHPEFESSRCLFIVRKDGEIVDFSYRKCIKGLIKKKYPSYANSFILRHFRQHKHK